MLKKIKSFLPHKIEDPFHYGDFKGSFNFLRQLSRPKPLKRVIHHLLFHILH